MPAKRELSMRQLRHLLRLHHDGVSAREIGRRLGVARSTIQDNLKRAAAAGLAWPLADDVTDEALETRLFGRIGITQGQRRRAEPDWAALARELKRPGVTMSILWEEYREVHPEAYGYSRFCDLLRGFERRLTPVMRQHHVAGEKAFVDYSGKRIGIADPTTGEIREAEIFVGVLGASNLTYAEATWTQTLPDWTGAHVRMFRFFGGAPKLLVPDYVAGHIIGILWPPPLCGALRAARWFPVVVIIDATQRATEVTRAPSGSFSWNGGCHVGTVLPQAKTVDRILGCWLGSRIEAYVTILCDQGYSTRTILRRVPILVEFASFTEARRIAQIEQAETLVDEFVADWVSARRADHLGHACRRDRSLASATVRQFFSLVVSQSEYRRARKPWGDPFAAEAPGFFEYLRAERGLRQRSIRLYQHYLRRFERYLHQVECPDIRSLALPVVTGFVTTAAQEFGSRTMVGLCSTLRVFLRYAFREGILQRDLSKLVEGPQHYRLADIPRSIGWDAVQKMLDQVDRRTAWGRRDYAMLLLMVSYGLRAREVSVLTLDDIDWKRDRLHVRERKADHTTAYPLARVVGEAIIDYLKNGRPVVQGRELFWRHIAPRAPLTQAAVSCVASKYLHRAGIAVARPGSHTLRHACVQRLVDAGFPLKTVGDYVGHGSPSSTMIYAKVQVDALREVALGDGEDLQ